MSKPKKKYRSQPFNWVIQHRTTRQWVAQTPDKRGNYGSGEYVNESGEWKTMYPDGMISRVILTQTTGLTSNERRRVTHPLELALKIAFKAQELLGGHHTEFQVLNRKTGEVIPVCGLC